MDCKTTHKHLESEDSRFQFLPLANVSSEKRAKELTVTGDKHVVYIFYAVGGTIERAHVSFIRGSLEIIVIGRWRMTYFLTTVILLDSSKTT